MSELVVRAYNVGFGDAVLVSIPERDARGRETTRHLLIDVGNLLAGKGNNEGVLKAAVADIADRTGGEVDLYVMTHEHLDHVRGLLAAARAGVPLRARYAWLTSSAHPDYYEKHPESRKRRLEVQQALEDTYRVLQADPDPELELLLQNNSAWLPAGAMALTTAEHVDHLRTLTRPGRTYYVDRETKALSRKHPFREAELRVLAPEPETSVYYGRSTRAGLFTASSDGRQPAAQARRRQPAELHPPPPGVDTGAYFDLLRSRRRGWRTRIMEIDAANNNTSLVLEISWRGWRLLFPGDAELRSWRTMHDKRLLRPAHLVKVSHHGSHNGTLEEIFEGVFPAGNPDGRERHALVSTLSGCWASIPDEPTLDFYRDRGTLHDTRDVAAGRAVEIVLPG